MLVLLCSCLLALSLGEAPQQIHLSFSGNETEMVVQWLTKTPQLATVKYGLSSTQLMMTATGSSFTYNTTVGYVHTTTLTGLTPATRYWYQCYGATGAATLFFDTAPFGANPALGRGQAGQPLYSIGVYGDLGWDESENTRARLQEAVVAGDLQWIFHLGDISYAGDFSAAEYAGVIDKFFNSMQPIMAQVAYMTCPGNNDRGCKNDSVCKGQLPYTNNFTDYKNRFAMPAVQSGSPGGNMFWSFNYGLIHFVAFSTETDFAGAAWGPDTGKQIAWLKADLAKANLPENRAKQPWVIVCGHRPMYTSIIIYNDYLHPIGPPTIIQKAFEEIFYENKVDIFFNGHIHGYERNWAVYDSKVSRSYVNAPYPIHIMSGAAGDIEGQDPAAAYSVIRPIWTAYRLVDPSPVNETDTRNEGYGVLHVYNATTLQWNFIRAIDNKQMDSAFIVKN